MYYPLHCLYLLLISYQMTMCTTIDTFSAFFHSTFPRCLAALRCLCGSGLCRSFFLSYFACCFQSFVFRFAYTPVSLSLFFIICVLTLLCPLLLLSLCILKSTVFSSAFITIHVYPSSVFPTLILACLWTFFISELDRSNKQNITFSSEWISFATKGVFCVCLLCLPSQSASRP